MKYELNKKYSLHMKNGELITGRFVSIRDTYGMFQMEEDYKQKINSYFILEWGEIAYV